MNDNYILPRIELLNKVKQKYPLWGNAPSNSTINDFKELYKYGFLIIIAEPGDGKSRLLKEVIACSDKYNKEGIYLDLKKINRSDILGKIEDAVGKPKKIKDFENINLINDYFSSENFKSINNSIICLDALDEVSHDTIFELIEGIKKFKNTYANVQIILSCRNYVYEEYDNFFEELNPIKASISPFGSEEIKKYLSKHSFSNDDIEETIRHFNSNFQSGVFNSPRTLEIFIKIKEKEGIKGALNKSRADLLEFFIYGRLKEEEKKKKKNKKELVKRVLEKLALTMEIYQANQITKDELMTFFDDINSNLAKDFLQQVSLDDFYERFILVTAENGEKIQFQNAEFQEYLAAKEITRLGKVDQVVFDLIINKDYRVIYSSWVNTFKYLLELYPKLLIQIVTFICRSNNREDFYFLERILSNDSNIPNLIINDRENIFKLILKRYQDLNWYLSESFVDKISLYFTVNNNSLLEEYSSEPDGNTVKVFNSITIARKLLARNKLPNSGLWKEKCITIIKNSKEDSLIIVALKLLSEFKDLNILRENFDFNRNELSSELTYEFIWSCITANPNDTFTIDLIIKNVKGRNRSIFPLPDFNHITSSNGIKYLLTNLINDKELLSSYESSLFDNYIIKQIVKNIEQVFDEEVKSLLKQLILLTNFYSDKLLLLIVELLQKKDNRFLFELVRDLDNKAITLLNWFRYRKIFEMLLDKQNTFEFISAMIQKERLRNQLLDLFLGFKSTSDSKKNEIYEISRNFFVEDYNKIGERLIANEKNWDRSEEMYKEFKVKLEPELNKYASDIFRYYATHKNELLKHLQPDDKTRIKNLLINTVLKFDFSKATLTITEQSPYSTSYSGSPMVEIFSTAFPLFDEFEISSILYKGKLLEFLPFAMLNDYEPIFKLLGDLSQDEISELIKFYQQDRQDDLLKANIKNLFYACRHYKLVSAVPVLKKIAENKDYELYKRIEALELISILSPDFEFYNQIFKEYSDVSDENHLLSENANEYLIKLKNPYRKKAIEWRIKKIVSNPQKASYEKNTILVPFDFEVKVSKFGNVLTLVTEFEFSSLFLKMLDDAIKIYNKGEDYQIYASYAWNVVLAYFENLIILNSFKPLRELENTLMKYKDFKGYSILIYTFNKIKTKYLNTLGKPSNYYECIKSYNRIKNITYSDVGVPEDFKYLIEDILNTDIKKWVEIEGAYSFTQKYRQEEELIQKTIKTQFENGLLKRGLRTNEVSIRREEQLLDNTRTDFVISYGFIGQVLIEIKLTKNPDVKKNTYPKKLKKYIDGTQSDYGVFLIFQTDDENPWIKLEPIVRKMYEPYEEIKVIGLNCTLNPTEKKKKSGKGKK